tara:strand:- start:1447 stop:2172 length:726 start_codon:yes stop_codon:yes gene_type:complete
MAETRKVKEGDTLSSIAKERGMSWKDLYEINKGVIGDNPNMLKVGTQLRFSKPEAKMEPKAQTPAAPTPTPDTLTDKEVSAYIQSYLDRPSFRNNAPGPQFTGEEVLRGMKNFAGKDQKKRKFIQNYLDEFLAQAQIEGALHGKGRSARNNPFNVGEFDEGTKMTFDSPEKGVSAYLNLMYKDYLPRVDYDYDKLLSPGNFVNKAGNRYASKPNYEEVLSAQLNYIRNKHTPPSGNWSWED